MLTRLEEEYHFPTQGRVGCSQKRLSCNLAVTDSYDCMSQMVKESFREREWRLTDRHLGASKEAQQLGLEGS